MVETEGTELPTPHPVIEPVSDTRARNGNFRCRDRGTKWAHSRRLQEQRPRRPENLADMSLTSRRYCECMHILYNYRVWVVGVIGIELVTPSLFERKTYDQNVFAPCV
jgi:hypothetical protein